MSELTPVPEVVAHRGASDQEPEHTLAAYQRAIELGADALECDVRLTADGHLVCVHDRRVERTSNGTGLVSTLELTQLEGLDWGAWKQLRDQRPPSQTPQSDEPDEPDVVERLDRAHLLTLRRLLSTVADSKRDLVLAIETKHPTRYAGQVERALVSLLDEFGLTRPAAPGRAGKVRVMSFSTLALRRMRQLAPAVPLVLLLDRLPISLREGSLPRGVDTAGISIEVLRAHPRYPDKARAQGHDVHVWTVDEPADVQLCLDARVQAIITNRPREVLVQRAEWLDSRVSTPPPWGMHRT